MYEPDGIVGSEGVPVGVRSHMRSLWIAPAGTDFSRAMLRKYGGIDWNLICYREMYSLLYHERNMSRIMVEA